MTEAQTITAELTTAVKLAADVRLIQMGLKSLFMVIEEHYGLTRPQAIELVSLIESVRKLP